MTNENVPVYELLGIKIIFTWSVSQVHFTICINTRTTLHSFRKICLVILIAITYNNVIIIIIESTATYVLFAKVWTYNFCIYTCIASLVSKVLQYITRYRVCDGLNYIRQHLRRWYVSIKKCQCNTTLNSILMHIGYSRIANLIYALCRALTRTNVLCGTSDTMTMISLTQH